MTNDELIDTFEGTFFALAAVAARIEPEERLRLVAFLEIATEDPEMPKMSRLAVSRICDRIKKYPM